MKYCHNCGAPLVDDVRFCTACGSPLDPPETEPAMPESAVMPEMPEPAPEMPVMPGEALPPEPPKKRKKRIWLWILLPVVVLALAAGALYYFLVWNAPEARVQRAWQKTAAALETEVGRPEKLMAFAETLRGPLSEQRALTATLTFESNGETLAAELHSQRDNATRRLGGTAELTVPWGEGTLPISFYGDAEELQLTLPGITDEVYSIPAHGVAEAYADSALGEMLGELGSLEDLDLFPEETARDPALSADLRSHAGLFPPACRMGIPAAFLPDIPIDLSRLEPYPPAKLADVHRSGRPPCRSGLPRSLRTGATLRAGLFQKRTRDRYHRSCPCDQ